MAACFLVAFWIGSLAQSRHAQFTTTNAPSIAVTSPKPHQTETIQPERAIAKTATPSVSPSSPWRVVTVSSPGNTSSGGSSLRLPAVERDRVDPQWLESLPSAVPSNVMQALDRSGHQVQQHRDLVPVRLEDGRQMVVPVDQVDVHYVGNGPY
jgi:hypothetical protein